jgi:hypothetical protein
MMFKDARDMADLYRIDPSLTCTCDEIHECQQCFIQRAKEEEIASHETSENLEQ